MTNLANIAAVETARAAYAASRLGPRTGESMHLAYKAQSAYYDAIMVVQYDLRDAGLVGLADDVYKGYVLGQYDQVADLIKSLVTRRAP